MVAARVELDEVHELANLARESPLKLVVGDIEAAQRRDGKHGGGHLGVQVVGNAQELKPEALGGKIHWNVKLNVAGKEQLLKDGGALGEKRRDLLQLLAVERDLARVRLENLSNIGAHRNGFRQDKLEIVRVVLAALLVQRVALRVADHRQLLLKDLHGELRRPQLALDAAAGKVERIQIRLEVQRLCHLLNQRGSGHRGRSRHQGEFPIATVNGDRHVHDGGLQPRGRRNPRALVHGTALVLLQNRRRHIRRSRRFGHGFTRNMPRRRRVPRALLGRVFGICRITVRQMEKRRFGAHQA